MKKITHIKDLYSFLGFRAQARLKPHPEMQGAHIVTLKRRQKKRCVPVVVEACGDSEADALTGCETWTPAERRSIWNSNTDAWPVRIANP